MRIAFAVLITIQLAAGSAVAAEGAIFRSGDEVIVQIQNLDLLRQAHPQLNATVRLTGDGGEKQFSINLSDRVVLGAFVVDVAGYGNCTSVTLDVKNGSGKTVHTQRATPLAVVKTPSDLLERTGHFAAIEAGSTLKPGTEPQIALPDLSKLRQEILTAPMRQVTSQEITYPVLTDADLPGLASMNCVLVSRQSSAPDDQTKCSLYFSYRKAVYDMESLRLKKWRKLLVEVPLQRAWLAKQGDAVITLPLDAFEIHTTDEREISEKSANPAAGKNMLGESSTGLAQGGQTADIDDQGRIYITNVADCAGIVRFNPHTRKFEQPPVSFLGECHKFLPTNDEWKRTWDADLGQVVCTRGRVYIVFARNYRVNTPNGKFETCHGVVSVPQEGWDNAAAFRKDIRLHAGCWSGAPHRLYKDDVAVGGSRHAGLPYATTQGIAFGSWRLDLNQKGDTLRLAEIKDLQDKVSIDGKPLPPAKIVTVQGLEKQRLINVGSAGRQFLRFAYGEFAISQAALTLTLPGAPLKHLVDSAGNYRITYDGAPTGTLTVQFDITTKIRKNPKRYGELASSLIGMSQGPTYAVTPIPGEPDRAIGVCEYSYYFSKLDFSHRQRERKVFKSYLPMLSNGQTTGLPLAVGLGPYNTTWVEHNNALWLYMMGYTGMTRLKYAEAGRTLEGFTSDGFHTRLAPQPIDGTQRNQVKDYLHIIPALEGRLIDIGRGRLGRGGGAYSAGLELFDPTTLGKSQTAVAMNRCYGLYTPVSRLVLSTKVKTPRQEIYVASGPVQPEYVQDIDDPAWRPKNQQAKVFAYDCEAGGNLRDRYGFALPSLRNGADNSGNIVLSPCGQFLVILQSSGSILTYHIAQRQFVDGVRLRTPADESVKLLEFSRPSATIWNAPNGQMFFLTAPEGDKSKSVQFFEVLVSIDGRVEIKPHLTVTWDGNVRVRDFDGVVRCFLPELTKPGGTYHFVLGGDQDNGGQPTVRVIEDFIPPRKLDRGT